MPVIMLPPSHTKSHSVIAACRIMLFGSVQGFGVRPAIARLAVRLNLSGSVANRLDGVEILLDGSAGQLDTFEGELLTAIPTGDHVDRMERHRRYRDGYERPDQFA